jgi:uncharacterized C2H2 Zn-finger protein
LYRFPGNWKAKFVRVTLSRSWRYFEHEETFEDIFPYNFQIALSFIEEVEATMEEEVADAVSEISGENNFPCENCDKICKSKGGLTRHKNAKYGNKITAGKENVSSPKISLTHE